MPDIDPWEEDKKLAEQLSKLSDREVADELRRAANSVSKVGLKRHDTPETIAARLRASKRRAERGGNAATLRRNERICELYRQGMPVRQIATEVQASDRTVTDILVRHDYIKRSKSLASQKVLLERSAARHEKIKELFAKGETLEAIGLVVDMQAKHVGILLKRWGLIPKTGRSRSLGLGSQPDKLADEPTP